MRSHSCKSVELAHLDVGDDGLEVRDGHTLEGRGGRRVDLDLEAAPREALAKQLAHLRVVFDDEDAPRHAASAGTKMRKRLP